MSILVYLHYMSNLEINQGSRSSQDTWNCSNIETRSIHFLFRKLNCLVVILPGSFTSLLQGLFQRSFLCRKFNHCDSLYTKKEIHESEEDLTGTDISAGIYWHHFSESNQAKIHYMRMWLTEYFDVLSHVKFIFFTLFWSESETTVSQLIIKYFFSAKDALSSFHYTFYSFCPCPQKFTTTTTPSEYLVWFWFCVWVLFWFFFSSEEIAKPSPKIASWMFP